MARSLLVLGGSGFVGPAVAEEGLRRGWRVATFNRGRAAAASQAVQTIVGDRLDRFSLKQLRDRTWDVVVDTWSGAPRAVLDSANALVDHAERYAYVSSGSVYEQPVPLGVRETSPTVAASALAEDGDYPALKRGGELAALEVFGERALLARAGLILGPHENVGRLTWWLNRIAAGGEVLAPGPPDLQLQFIDARDLAAFVLDAALDGHAGPYNVASRRGHATMRSLLQACQTATGADARLTWLDPAAIKAAEIEAWTELPIWLPPDSPSIAMHAADVEHAHAAGLSCRPALETVTETWRWLATLDGSTPIRSDLEPTGLASSRERAALNAWHTTQRHQR
ncbi:MAG: NAD-dependent epimerase/dehydratase family protein [Solirubrobacteraceae bacterium]